MIFITGLGRCGTSILTKYLNEVGFCIGFNQQWYDEARAGYELKPVVEINFSMWFNYCQKGKPINVDDNVCDHFGRVYNLTYRNAINLLFEGEVTVIKDPRLTWHPDIVEAWWSVRNDLKFLICHRDIESVMKSREVLPKEFADLKNRSLLEYKGDFADFFTRVLKLKIPYETLFFPDFLQDFQSTYEVLEKVGLHFDYASGKKVWDNLIDKTLLKET
jgi:hypothetical protein